MNKEITLPTEARPMKEREFQDIRVFSNNVPKEPGQYFYYGTYGFKTELFFIKVRKFSDLSGPNYDGVYLGINEFLGRPVHEFTGLFSNKIRIMINDADLMEIFS